MGLVAVCLSPSVVNSAFAKTIEVKSKKYNSIVKMNSDNCYLFNKDKLIAETQGLLKISPEEAKRQIDEQEQRLGIKLQNKILATAVYNKANTALEKAITEFKEEHQDLNTNDISMIVDYKNTDAAHFSIKDKSISIHPYIISNCSSAIKHELTHKYIDEKLGFMPNWLDEGFATQQNRIEENVNKEEVLKDTILKKILTI